MQHGEEYLKQEEKHVQRPGPEKCLVCLKNSTEKSVMGEKVGLL